MILNLIDDEALEYAIKMGGGVMRELIWIIRTSCIEAVVFNQNTITKPIVEKAVNERINDFKRILTRIEEIVGKA